MKIFNPFENMTEEELNTWNEIAINSKFDAQREHIYGKNRIRRMQRREFRAGDTIENKVVTKRIAKIIVHGNVADQKRVLKAMQQMSSKSQKIQWAIVRLQREIAKASKLRNKKTKTSTKLKNLRRKYI